MRNHTNKRNSSFNISRKALKQDDSIGDMSDELSSILNITGTNTLLDISLDGGSSSIVVDNGDNVLATLFGGGTNHHRVTHNVGTSSQFLSHRKKNKKKKKKKGYVGSLKLQGATANEESEMIDHGEL
jgi:hypothetical protein